MGEWRQQEGERLLPTRVSLEQPLFQLPSPGSLLVFPLRHLSASLALAEAELRAPDVPARQPFLRGLGPLWSHQASGCSEPCPRTLGPPVLRVVTGCFW